MVWLLEKDGADSALNIIKLLPGKEYVVGRKDVDIALMSDQSISRKHAVIKVTSEMLAPGNVRGFTAVLKDYSKYGTSINGLKVTSGMDIVLNDGDNVLFGVFDNRWRIRHDPFVCCTSCLAGDEKMNVQHLVSKLGGQIVTEWTPKCTLLIMNKITLTIKVVNVLVSLRNIVTPKYLEDYYDAATKNQSDPDPNHYVPPLEKSNILDDSVDFSPNVTRRTVFRGITFISFALKQVKKLQFTLKETGAELKFKDVSNDCLHVSIIDKDVCVLQPPKFSVPSEFESKLGSYLERYEKRIIPEGEVGLAVLFCSRSKYCNPDEVDTNLFQASLLDTQHSSYDLTYNTQASCIKMEQIDTFDVDTEIDSTGNHSEVEQSHSETLDWSHQSEQTSPSTSACCNGSSSIASDVIESEVVMKLQPLIKRSAPKLESPLFESKREPADHADEDESTSYDEKSYGNTTRDERTSTKLQSMHSSKQKAKKIDPNDDVELECGAGALVVIRVASLIRKRDFGSRSEIGDKTVKNFKRFKKVMPRANHFLTNGDKVERMPQRVRLERVVQSQTSTSYTNEEEDCTDSANVFDWD